MIISHSIRTRQRAQGLVLRFNFLNAVAVGLSFGTVLPLLALHYGAGDGAMMLLYAAIHVAAFASVLVPFLLPGRETTRVWSRFWMVRGLISLGYLALPLLAGDRIKVAVLLVLYYGFQLARSFGMSAYFSVIRSICPAGRMKSFSGRGAVRFNAGVLLASTAAFWVLHAGWFANEEYAYLLLIGIGCVFNLLAAGELRRLPETGMIERSPWRTVVLAFRRIRRSAGLREVFGFSAGVSALIICHSFIINFLKLQIGYSSAKVFLITAFGLGVAIGASQLLRLVGDHVSARVLLLIGAALLLFYFICWMWAPGPVARPGLGLHMLLFGCGVLGLSLFNGVLIGLQSARLPGRFNVQITMCFQAVSVVGALLLTGWLGIFRAPATEWFVAHGGHAQSYVFFSGAVLSLLMLLGAVRSASERDLNLSADFAMLSAPNLLTMYRISKAEGAREKAERDRLIETAMTGPSRLSREMLLGALRSPDVGRRFQAYRLLGRIRPPAAYGPALEEAMDAYAPLRREAVTLLGLLGNRAAVPHLQRLMNDGESSRGDLRAAACKSLLRLGAEVSDATVSTLYREPIGMLGRLDILIGLSSVRREELLLRLLSRDRECLQSRRWMEAAFMTAAELYQRREMAEYFFRVGAKQRDSQGLLLLREFGEVLNTEPALKTALENRDTAQMASLLNRLNPPGFPKMDPHGPPAAVYAWVLLWCARQEYQQTESGGTS